jgi:hypothetical protein
MNRRLEWRKVLDAELKLWSAKSCQELVSELSELRAYQLEMDSQPYQVEVELLENTAEYVHVSVSVDDGSLPSSLVPLSESFTKRKG